MTGPMMSQGEGTLGILEALRREQSQVPFLMMLMIFLLMLTCLVVKSLVAVWYWIFILLSLSPPCLGVITPCNDAAVMNSAG